MICRQRKGKANGIPILIYGEESEKVVLVLHGRTGDKREANPFADTFAEAGYQVVSYDIFGAEGREMPETPGRIEDKTVEGNAVKDLQSVYGYCRERWQQVVVFGHSMGSYLCQMALQKEAPDRCLFVSPIYDGTWNTGILPVSEWHCPTAVLYGGKDQLQRRQPVEQFAQTFGASLTVIEESGHFFAQDGFGGDVLRWITTVLSHG